MKKQISILIRFATRDANSSQLVGFPSAYGVTLLIGLGMSLLAWGLVLFSVWLAATGAILTLTAAALYGVSLAND